MTVAYSYKLQMTGVTFNADDFIVWEKAQEKVHDSAAEEYEKTDMGYLSYSWLCYVCLGLL